MSPLPASVNSIGFPEKSEVSPVNTEVTERVNKTHSTVKNTPDNEEVSEIFPTTETSIAEPEQNNDTPIGPLPKPGEVKSIAGEELDFREKVISIHK